MEKKTKIILIATGLTLVLGGVGYYFYNKKKKDGQAKSMGDYGYGDDDEYITDKELKEIYQDECSAKPYWKARGALTKGLIIRPEWERHEKYDTLSDCDVLSWMYHLKYESNADWATSLEGNELYQTALHQAYMEKKNK